MRLEGRRAIVTGASRGLGRAIALAFAREGADVLANFASREEQAKDDFVGFASHELRSPLTAMHGFSSWLAKKLEREPWQFDALRFHGMPLPTTLQHLLLTRLGALTDTERITLQRGSIFGRSFWDGGLEALAAPDGARPLRQLQPRGFVEAQPESAFQTETEWSFQQGLLQEVTYESVLHATDRFNGIGFNLLDCELGAIDLDKCRDPETGAIAAWALKFIERAPEDAYVETTVSGTGLRIIGTTSGASLHRKFEAGDGKGSFELYRRPQTGRYITISGLALPGRGNAPLPNIDALLDELLAEYDSKKHKADADSSHGRQDIPRHLLMMLHIPDAGGHPLRSRHRLGDTRNNSAAFHGPLPQGKHDPQT